MSNKLRIRVNSDGLVNVASGLGTAKAKRTQNRWAFEILNSFEQLDAAFQTNWIARGICEIPAKDMTREWRRIRHEQAEEITAVEQQFCVSNLVEEAITWAKLYGGSGILMVTDQDLTKPLDVTRIKRGSLKRLITLDRYDLSAQTINTNDILASNYLQPQFYSIRGGMTHIHYTHVARFMGERLPLRYQLQTQGWGDSVLRKCIDEVADMVAAKDGIAELMQEANIDVITREGLSEELASEQDDEIIKRYETFSQMKSVIQMALLDGDETFDRKTLNLSGVAPIIELFMTWISGCARIPVTKLFGTSAQGLNATGEGDMKNYYDDIRAAQRSMLVQPLRTLDEVLVRSAIGDFPDSYDYEWNPLAQSNQLEEAQSDQLRAQVHDMYLNSGVITKSQIQRELQANEDYQFEDEAIDELAELESANMFETLPDLSEQPGETEELEPIVDPEAEEEAE